MTWTLVILVWVGGFSSKESNALTTVPGFTSKEMCESGARSVKTMESGAKSISTVCVHIL